MSVDKLLVNFATHHPRQVADRMDHHPTEDIAQLLELLPPQVACSVAAMLASRPLSAVLKIISRSKLGTMLVVGQYTDVIALVSHMSTECQQQLLSEAPDDDQQQLSRLFHTSLKTLSGIASPNFVRVELDNSCGDVGKQLVSSEENEEQPIFVVNEQGEYQGIVSPMVLLQEINATRRIADVLQRVEALSGFTPFAAAIGAPQWTRFRALPVVDRQSRLLGALTFEQLARARKGLSDADFGLGELIGEVASGYIDICANLMELTVGENPLNLNDHLIADYFTRYPGEAAHFIEQSAQQRFDIGQVPADSMAPLFEHLDPSHARELFLSLPQALQLELIETLSIGTTLNLLSNLNDQEREALFNALPEGSAGEIRKLLAFPADTAGYYMDSQIGHFRTSMTVHEALERVRDSKRRRARSIYVVEDGGKLAGRVDLQDMALSEGETLLSTLLNPVEGFAQLISHREELIKTFDQYRTDSIPVVDHDNKLIGVVRYAALFQAAEDEATVNIQTMVGASADERALSPALFAVKKRLPWLHINLLTAFLAAAVVGFFESIIAQFTALAILLPVVAGQSGNAGSQALAVTMRGLALKEVTGLQWKVVLAKEIQVGLIDGLALALTCGLGVYVWSQSIGLALVIAIAMVCSMVAAGLAGALVPMTLVRIGQDPATASSIILTTVTDVAGFISFLGTATLMSSML